jgi:cytochrome c
MRFAHHVLAVSLVAAACVAQAQERGTKQEAVAMVDAAVAHAQKVGLEQAFKDFTDKANAAWRKKDLYVFVVRSDGVTTAHGGNDKLIGKNMLGIKDQSGKAFIQEMIATAKKGPGWVDYEWVNPQTQKQEGKSSYVKPVAGFDGFLGVGIYR